MPSLLLVLLSTMLVNVFVLGAPGARGNRDSSGQWSEEIRVAVFAILMFVMVALGGYVLRAVVLDALGFGYVLTLSLLALIAAIAPVAHWIVHRFLAPDAAMPRFAEMVTDNAAFLGVALFSATQMHSAGDALLLGIGCAVGYAFALLVFASLRKRIAEAEVPRAFRGTPIALITAGIMALALLGLSGLVKI